MPFSQRPIMVTYMATTDKLQHSLQIVHYLSPIVVIVYYLLAAMVSVCTLQNLKASRTGPRQVLLWLISSVLVSYIVEACMLLTDTMANDARFSSTDSNICALSNLLVWMILVVSVADAESPVWFPHYGSWFIALLAEALLFALGLSHGLTHNTFVYTRMTVQACRMLVLVALPTFLFSKSSKPTSTTDEENTSLLAHDKPSSKGAQQPNGGSHYGSVAALPSDGANLEYEAEQRKEDEEQQQKLEKSLEASGNWFKYINSFLVLLPIMWPSKQSFLHLNMLGVGLCILCTRVLNVLEPRQFGIVLDGFNLSQGYVPVTEALLYLLYMWLSSSLVSPIKYALWLPVELYAEASIKTAAYNQIMGLSRDFHTEKQSGELYKSIEQGSSVTSLLETIMFQVVPMFVDIIVAFSYLYYVFGPYMALIVAATTMIYLWASSYSIAKQVEPLRRSNGLARKENQLMYDSVGGWNSVSYFNRQTYEKGRYSNAVDSTMLFRRKNHIIRFGFYAVQDTIMEIGLISAGILALYQIAHGTHKVGSFAMLMAYWGSFTGRLGFFAHAQRQIRESLVDAESLLDLLQRKPTVKDGHNEFKFKSGTIHFYSVGFSYDGKKETINDFNFHAGPGQSIALVGETGGGKSTILKLLFRFYDVQEGRIMIDDQDIKDVTLQSLRQRMGTVPQDPALFNNTIMENVRYSKLGATDEEVVEACKGAAIHEKILTFTDGYQTKVGENGVKLSGGELQRIAIARIILKNAEIILLDEATSAVDTETEAHIQQALHKLMKGRTTITVAHRLSTVANADVIVVIKGGRIVEQGSPHALLEAKGKFSELWLKQIGINPMPTNEKATNETPVREKTSDRSDIPKPTDNDGNIRSTEASSWSGKSLRPTAPEFVPRKDFVPRNQRGTAAKGGQDSHDHETLGHQHRHDASNTNGGITKPQQKRKSLLDHSSDAVGDDSQWESDSKHGGVDRVEAKKKRPNPAQRRRNNKSDPSGSTSKPNHHAGLSDEQTPHSTDGGSAVRLQSRRVSVSGRPLSSATNVSQGAGGQRRRNKRWANQKRESSGLSSEDTSGHGSGALSGETLHPPTPIVRLPAPTESTNPSNGSNATGAVANSGVHFAPGF